MELENLQANLRSEHVKKMNTMFYTETENLRKLQQQSNEILQQNYLLLRANMLMTTDMESKYQQLYKAFEGHRAVKFSNEEMIRYEYDEADMILKGDVGAGEMQDMDWDDLPADPNRETFLMPTGPKARRALHTLPDVTVSAPEKSEVINATLVLAKHDDDTDEGCQPLPNINSTFSLNVAKTNKVTINRRPLPLSRALKDANPNVNKETAVSKGNLSFFSFFLHFFV